MDRLRLKAEGFTLIELLVVIAIIGILAAIAIPQFAAYRRRGFDADAKANSRNMATAQEAYFVDQNTYTTALADLKGDRGYTQSENISSSITAGTSTTFIVAAVPETGCSGTTGTWRFTSTTGVIDAPNGNCDD
jgi:prepilin-type N-terminal cleavage/methylation domain-containing protein